jgi:asparagine synthase (glutamine-hydrolysing)
LVWKDGKYTITTYWQVTDFSNLSSRTEARKQIKELFRDSVQHQLISDRPVGVFLSGGVDSTAVLGVAKEFHAGKIKTFSVGFKDSTDPAKFNADFELAHKTAAYYGTDHQELMIGPDDIQDNLEKIVWHLDEPNSNPTAGAMFLLSERAKCDVAVVLGGDGGDELFGGYPRYYYSRLISTYQCAPRMFQFSSLQKLKLAPGAERVIAFLGQKSGLLSQVIKSEILQSDGESYIQEYCLSGSDKQRATDFEKYFMNVDRQSWLVDESLLRTNKMCLAWGLEPRVPILDYRLVELANRIPTAWKLSIWKHRPSQFQGKDIWREAIEDYLPAHILHQQKRGWFTPMAKWLRTPRMQEYISEVLSPARLQAEFFNVNEVQKIWHDHVYSKQYNLAIIWAIVMWQLWYEKFIKE